MEKLSSIFWLKVTFTRPQTISKDILHIDLNGFFRNLGRQTIKLGH